MSSPEYRQLVRNVCVALVVVLAIAACSSDGTDTESVSDGSDSPSSGGGGWADGATAIWFDHEWSFSEFEDVTPADAEGRQRTIETTLTLRNPLTDVSYSIPTDWLSLRTGSGDRFETSNVVDDADGVRTSRLDVGAESRGDFSVQFEIPGDEDLGALSIEIGAAPNRLAMIDANEVSAPSTTPIPVSLATTSWSGEYGWNSAEISILDSFARLSAGQYDNGGTRPEPSADRQADEGQVFIQLDAEITEISTSSVIGVAFNTHRIVADGDPIPCTLDTLGSVMIEAETRSYSVTCPTPVNASSLSLEIGTDPCVGGCTEWTWTSVIDASFLESFR